jgi:hypothetical protein
MNQVPRFAPFIFQKQLLVRKFARLRHFRKKPCVLCSSHFALQEIQ